MKVEFDHPEGGYSGIDVLRYEMLFPYQHQFATLKFLFKIFFSDTKVNEVHQKDNISRILWYSDWLHNTTSAGNSIFVTIHNTTSCGRSIMQPIRLP